MLSIVLFSGLSLATPVDPFEEADDTDLFLLERQVVTVASRYAQTLEEAPSIITVITDEDIRMMGYRTLSDVLRPIPGVYMSMSKESRSLAWFRGVISSDNNKILLLIDGVPWYDGVYNHAWLDEAIPLYNVKQVEVIKGPGSAVYGSNAFAGVINVVTYSAEDLDGGVVRFSTGSFARTEIGAMVGKKLGDDTKFRGYARKMEARGDGLSINPKGQHNVTAANPKQAINGGVELSWKDTQLRYDFMDYTHTYFVNPQDDIWSIFLESPDEFNLNYRNDFFYLRSNLSMGLMGTVSPYLFTQRYYNSSNYAYTTGYSQDEEGDISLGQNLVQAVKFTERYGVGLEAHLQPGTNHISVFGTGADLTYVAELQDYQFTNGAGEKEAIDFGAEPGQWITDVFVFGQHTWTATWWMELTAGARLDAYNYAGLFVSPRLGLLFVPASGGSIKLLYGRAFRAPNARELMVYVIPDEDGNISATNGNPELVPEVIDTIEFDLSGYGSQDFWVRGSAFVSMIQDLIDKNVLPAGQKTEIMEKYNLGNQYYDNLGSVMALGGELEFKWHPSIYAIDLSYSATYATDMNTGFMQYEFPQHMGHFRLGVNPEKKVWLNLRGDVYGKRPRAKWTADGSGLPDGDPFALVHLNMSASPFKNDNISIESTVYNLLDSNYKTLIYLDDVNALSSDGTAKYPNDIEGEERSLYVGINSRF